ncbi:hypothetical protein T459_21620 [Capsicum annuum]|uniref:RNase H type-1 domain-containing protein n=1 Tax=Capsicum annuum TaxID=4072 RepID=A0A2G2YXA3_CAPAN|nr:hypothetical protein T459_21620 [Capsicum annuum]
MPTIIIWFLWKRRNTIRHNGAYQERKIFWEINDTIIKFVKVRFYFKVTGREWSKIVDELKSIRIHNSYKLIKWNPPKIGLLKGNTDGASKGNPGPTSIALCIRNHYGDLVVAQGNRIKDITSLEAEAMAILECLKFRTMNSISQIIVKSDS